MGIVTTGSEVKKGLIQDTFTPVLREKLAEYSCQVMGQTTPGDEKDQITGDILKFIENGADMVICSGGMSVDPDDRTPGAIRATGAEVVTYGAPVLPGAMLLLAYYRKGKDHPHPGPSGLRDVCKKNRVRSGSAENRGRRSCPQGRNCSLWGGRTLPELQRMYFPNCGFGK